MPNTTLSETREMQSGDACPPTTFQVQLVLEWGCVVLNFIDLDDSKIIIIKWDAGRQWLPSLSKVIRHLF
jgi:hypothetical protein